MTTVSIIADHLADLTPTGWRIVAIQSAREMEWVWTLPWADIDATRLMHARGQVIMAQQRYPSGGYLLVARLSKQPRPTHLAPPLSVTVPAQHAHARPP